MSAVTTVTNARVQSQSPNPEMAPKAPELSKLVGPQLDVPVQLAIQMLRNSFDNHHDKVAVASMFQPAHHLQAIFDTEHTSPTENESRNYLRWTYGQIKHAGELLAVALAERGVIEGNTIAAFLHGSVDFYVLFYTSLILRCRFSPLNFHSIENAEEMRSMLKTVNPKVVCATDGLAMRTIIKNMPELEDDEIIKAVVETPSETSVVNGHGGHSEYLQDMIIGAHMRGSKAILDRFETLEQSPEDDVIVIFTSGTSALPKACPLTNRNLTSIATAYGKGPASGPTAVACNHLPIYHIAGIITGGWNPLANGGRVVHPAPSFSPKTTIEAIKEENVTFMVLVPSMIVLLLNDPALPPPSEMSIQNVSLGASTILYTDVEKCYEFLGAKRVITSYGMTEGIMMTRGYLPREPTEAAINGIQNIAPGTRLKICAPNSNVPIPRGEAGEVHQGGASTVKGYIGKESDNFYTDEDGLWCKTGDQAIMHPNGGIQITGRYKDLIIRGGVNISPQAIEGFISRILGLEAHVVAMPDSIAGEVPVAIVRDADFGKATPQKLRSRIIQELGPRFALEKFMSLSELGMTEFPKTSTGKIRKVDLQAAVRKYAQANAAGEQTVAEGVAGKTVDRLITIWSDIAGVDAEDLNPQTSLRKMGDSLTLARYATTVRTKFGRPFTLADLEKAETLEEQAAILDSRGEESSATVDLYSERTGPPTGSEMSHVGDDEEALERTKQVCEETLIPMGFAWQDVQDVITPSQWLQSWVKTRETSDRFRAAYVSTGADVATFTDALTETLRRNDSLRAISLKAGDGTDLQVILRHGAKWLSKVIEIHPQPVEKLKDLENIIPGDFKLNHGLARIVIAYVEETHSAGCCLMTNHSTFDAFSLNIMRNDLNYLLNKTQPKLHVPYKLWADHLHNTQGSTMANSSVRYNVRRLKGLSSKRAALWPAQRAPVWQRGCDRGLHVTPEGVMTTPNDPNQRPLLDGPAEKCTGSAGMRREITPRDLNALPTEQNIPIPILMKAALVLLETRLTSQPEALFTQTFSMRDNWPFMDEWMSRRLPSPLEITGPTLARVAEIVPVDRSKNALQWMKELKAEQDVLIKHCHAPYRYVFDELNRQSQQCGGPQEQSSTSSEPSLYLPPALDGAVMESIRQRINFQWLPTFTNDSKVKSQVRLASASHFNEVGFAVKAGLMGGPGGKPGGNKSVWLKMEWDDGNIRSAEVRSWITEMAKYVEILGGKEGWAMSLEEVYASAGFGASTPEEQKTVIAESKEEEKTVVAKLPEIKDEEEQKENVAPRSRAESMAALKAANKAKGLVEVVEVA